MNSLSARPKGENENGDKDKSDNQDPDFRLLREWAGGLLVTPVLPHILPFC
jgi:hypothetical protein